MNKGMTIRILRKVLGVGFLASILTGCGDGRTASTEVENEIALFDGVVAVGRAVSGVRVEVVCACGRVLAADTTDLSGRYALEFSWRKEMPPAWIRAVLGAETLKTVAVCDSRGAFMRYRHINPWTDWFVRDYERRGEFPDSVQWVVEGRESAVRLLGSAEPWDALDSDSAFRAWVPGDESRSVSAADALIHSMSDYAALRGWRWDGLIAAHRAGDSPLFWQREFQEILARRLALLSVDTIEGRRALDIWFKERPDLRDSVWSRFHEMRRLESGREAPETFDGYVARLVRVSVEDLIRDGAIGAAEQPLFVDLSVRLVLGALESVRDSAYTEQMGQRLLPFAEEVVELSGKILLEFSAAERLSKTAWVLETADSLMRRYGVGDFDVRAMLSDESGSYFLDNYQPLDPADLRGMVEDARKQSAPGSIAGSSGGGNFSSASPGRSSGSFGAGNGI